MSKKKTQSEYASEVPDHIKVLGTYDGLHTYIDHLCLTHNKVFSARPIWMRKVGVGCHECQKERMRASVTQTIKANRDELIGFVSVAGHVVKGFAYSKDPGTYTQAKGKKKGYALFTYICAKCGKDAYATKAQLKRTEGKILQGCAECNNLGGFKDRPCVFKEDKAWANSLSSFYLASVHWDEFVKVGIAKDFWARTNIDKTHDTEHRAYTCPIFISQKYPRSWVWTAEQIILQETKHLQGVVPEDWDKWTGSSELRTFMLDTDQVVLRFYELMEEIATEGWEAVYDTYMELETIKVPEVNYDIKQVTVNQHMLKTRVMVEKVLAQSR